MLLDLWRAKCAELARCKQIVHTWDNQSGINKAWLGAESPERTDCKWQSMICERVDAAGAAGVAAAAGAADGVGSGSTAFLALTYASPGPHR